MSDSQEKYLELMHAELDGEASDEDLVALREYLSSNPEAQKVHSELAKLTAVLNQVEMVETPGDLHTNILEALPPRRSEPGSVLRMRPWPLRIPQIQFGYALAAGLLLGAILTGFTLKSTSTVENSDFYGTMTARKDAPHSVAAEQMKLDAPDLGGSVALSQSGSKAMIVFDLSAGQPVEVEVGFESSQASFEGFSQQPSGIRWFDARNGRISFECEGKHVSTILLANERNAPLVLDLKFYEGGKLVYQGTLGSPNRFLK